MKAKLALTLLGSALLTAALPATIASADEAHTDSHNGVTLISIGQIDDPMEDVLEHAAIFGETSVQD
ncbi:hypothetical protein [Streptomyces sp. NPDC051567]|uniref:hypothetical protein n=1 Tax=Streptomyces sp. NPDC051567 TaxID=3365660 RepID=UPI0037B8DD64